MKNRYQRLAEEREYHSKPVPFETDMLDDIRALGRYCWWLYPNFQDGIYSKVFARINTHRNLVVSSREKTCLVIIKNGRLSLTRQFSDDVVNVYDDRLFVCL